MRFAFVFVLAIFASSCSGSKKAIEAQSDQTKEITMVSETPNTNEIPEPKSDDGEIKEMIEVVDKQGNTIAEVSSHGEAKELFENTIKHDSVICVSQGYFTTNHSEWNDLLQKYVSKNGDVNYEGFKKDMGSLNNYINSLTETKPNDKWSKENKLAFWINAYNALTIDLIIRNYPLNSIKDIKDPWDQRLWKFGDTWLNLNDIEHKILRKMNEPRIHFAIVCASESCPKLFNEAFTADNLEAQLTNATKAFLSDSSKNEVSENDIKLSKIFKWFAKDFKSKGSLIDFLNQYTEVNISDKAKKSFKTYDWSLNN